MAESSRVTDYDLLIDELKDTHLTVPEDTSKHEDDFHQIQRSCGTPSSLRPSMAEIHEFNRKDKAAVGNRRRRNQDREDAWVAKRREQKGWFERTGLEAIRERRRGFLGEKRGIEHDLLALAMTM